MESQKTRTRPSDYAATTTPHFIHPCVGWWTFGLFFPLFGYLKLLGTLVYEFLPRHMFLFLLGIYLGVELLVTDHSLVAKGLA